MKNLYRILAGSRMEFAQEVWEDNIKIVLLIYQCWLDSTDSW